MNMVNICQDIEDSGFRFRDFSSQKTWIEKALPQIMVIKPKEEREK